VLLDGTHDWLSPVLARPLRVELRAGADRDCVSVAAASVLAKVSRDRLMIFASEEYPAYDWQSNKGYGSARHRAAIDRVGLTVHHRRTWIH